MRTPLGKTTLVALGLAIAAGLVLYFVWPPGGESEAAGPDFALADIPFNGQRSYEMLKTLCDLGPHPSGSAAMTKQQELLTKHFTSLGGKVTRQTLPPVRHPQTGKTIEDLANLIVEWHPERKERVLLVAHYDTRPYPDRDPANPLGVFVGANDGASGAALLAELAYEMPKITGKYGVDFLLVDAEELVYVEQRDSYFLGSEHFARDYRANPPAHKYVRGVVVDMIGDKELRIYQEVNSMKWRDTRPLVKEIWDTAARLGVKEFVPQIRHEIRDDHIPLHDTAGIPTCDLIDFDYPRPGTFEPKYWHTTADTPDKCGVLSLAKVGWVLTEWLKSLK